MAFHVGPLDQGLIGICDCHLQLCCNLQMLYVLTAGFIGSLFSLLQFLCCPLIGAVSDVFGRRVPMIVCMVRKSFNLHFFVVEWHSDVLKKDLEFFLA